MENSKKLTIVIPIQNSSVEELQPIAEHFDCTIEKRYKSKADPYYKLSSEDAINFFWFGINLISKLNGINPKI